MRHVTLQSFQVMLRKKVVMKIRRKIEKLNNNRQTMLLVMEKMQVAKIEIWDCQNWTSKTFTWKPTEWPTFIESFETAVDSNRALSNIQKFQYLKGYLSGQAEKSIEGFLLTNDNYTEAL